MNKIEFIPYTYLIGWSKIDRWYYGSETSIKRPANPKNLWTKYHTSSEYVKQMIRDHGQPDVIEVRRTFGDKNSARDWEHKVLRRMKLVHNERWINRTDNRTYDRTGTPHSIETRRRMSEKRKGRKPALDLKHSEETKKLYSVVRKGKHSSSHFVKGSKWMYNPHNMETKQISPTLLQTFLENGWIFGKFFTQEHRDKINKNPAKIAKTAEKNRNRKRGMNVN